MYVNLVVPGIPVPQGSKTAMGRVLVDTNRVKLKPWRAEVTAAAVTAMAREQSPPSPHPVALHAAFYFPRPKHHYGTGRNADTVKPTAPDVVAVRPDLDKLVRAVLDACTGVVYRDDAQVVHINVWQVYTQHHPRLSAFLTDEAVQAPPWE